MVDPAALRPLSLFAGLAPAALRVLAARAVERCFPAGRVMYSAGSSPSGLLVILEGRVRLVRGRGDRQHLVHEEVAGGTLGDIPVFSGGSYPATAIAAVPVRCVLLSADALHAAIRADPGLAFGLLRRLAQRTRELVDRVDRLAAQGVNGRLARLLLVHSAGAGPGTAFSLGRNQVEVAEELGTVREVLVRALRQLRELGLIETVARGRYRVRDARRLAALAE